MTPHVKYVSICVQREITLNSGKEISAPQIIQGREFTTRDITSFTYQVMCWREFTISRLFFFFLSFLIIFSLSFPLISLPCFWFFDFFSPPLRGGGNAKIYSPGKELKWVNSPIWISWVVYCAKLFDNFFISKIHSLLYASPNHTLSWNKLFTQRG